MVIVKKSRAIKKKNDLFFGTCKSFPGDFMQKMEYSGGFPEHSKVCRKFRHDGRTGTGCLRTGVRKPMLRTSGKSTSLRIFAIRQNTESVCQNRRRVRPGYPNGVHSLTCKVQKTESHLFSKPRCPKEYSACRHGFRPAVPHACFRPVRAHKAAIPRAEPRFPL